MNTQSGRILFAAGLITAALTSGAIGHFVTTTGEAPGTNRLEICTDRGKLVASTIGAVRTIETLKASGLEDEAFANWAGIQAKTLNADQELGLSAAGATVQGEIVTTVDHSDIRVLVNA